jgi:hypothetical protein
MRSAETRIATTRLPARRAPVPVHDRHGKFPTRRRDELRYRAAPRPRRLARSRKRQEFASHPEIAMTVRLVPPSTADAVQRVRDSCDFRSLDSRLTREELEHRAALVTKLLRTRQAVERLRERTRDLQSNLDRFKQRRAALRG